MTLTTKAAVLRSRGAARPYADSRPLSIETVTLDPPGPGEVLVAIKAAGLCHSDLSVINGDRPRPLPIRCYASAPAATTGFDAPALG